MSRYQVDKDERVVTRADALVRDGSVREKPSGVIPVRWNTSTIEGVQTSEPGFVTDTAILRIQQTPHGAVNKHVIFEMFSFADMEDDYFGTPSATFALDHIVGRKLINELAKMLHIDLQSQRKNRGYLGKKQ